MSYIAATFMNADAWTKQGTNWLRKAKSARLTGFVIGSELPAEAAPKAKELGFTVVPLIVRYGDEHDIYHTLAEVMVKGQRCLFTRPETTPPGGLPETRDVTCSRQQSLDAIEIVPAVRNLQDRAKSVKLIRDRIERVHGGLLSPKYVLGTWDFWVGYTAFQNYLHEKNYLDRRTGYDELTLNLYMALAESISIEVCHD